MTATAEIQRKPDKLEKWTPLSRRPPRPGDAPFFGADFDVFMHGTGWVGVIPKPTKAFEQLSKRLPALKAELERLCQAFQPEALSALADALQSSAKGALKRGPRRSEVPADIVVEIKDSFITELLSARFPEWSRP